MPNLMLPGISLGKESSRLSVSRPANGQYVSVVGALRFFAPSARSCSNQLLMAKGDAVQELAVFSLQLYWISGGFGYFQSPAWRSCFFPHSWDEGEILDETGHGFFQVELWSFQIRTWPDSSVYTRPEPYIQYCMIWVCQIQLCTAVHSLVWKKNKWNEHEMYLNWVLSVAMVAIVNTFAHTLVPLRQAINTLHYIFAFGSSYPVRPTVSSCYKSRLMWLLAQRISWGSVVCLARWELNPSLLREVQQCNPLQQPIYLLKQAPWMMSVFKWNPARKCPFFCTPVIL